MNLSNIEKLIVKEMMNINIPNILENFNFPKHIADSANNDPYYACLAAYAKLFNIQNCLELGTCTAVSSLIISKFAKNVDSFDISHENITDQNLFNIPNLNLHLLNQPEDCLQTINSKYDMIFVDIDHMGTMESKIHQQIINANFKGIAFYDDIAFNSEMNNFWNNIQNDKLDTFWHFSKFGLVFYP